MSARHFFLGHRTQNLYCVEHIPDKNIGNTTGIILCPPLWGERIRTHRIFTNLGRMLCQRGFYVVTCDYFGDGNSSGDTQNLTFASMVDDIAAMNHYLHETYFIKECILIGLRMGATAAVAAEKEIQNVRKLLLIEPVCNPFEYLKEGLLSNLTTQMTVHKKVIKNRDILIREINNGVPVNMDGFLINKALFESFENIDFSTMIVSAKGETVIIGLEENGKIGKGIKELSGKVPHLRVESVEKEFYWHMWKKNSISQVRLFRKINQEIPDVPRSWN